MFFYTLADVIIINDSDSYDFMIGNISDLPDGGNSNMLVILATNSQNSLPTDLFDNYYELEESEGQNLVEINNFNYDPTINDNPQDTENNWPFGGVDNDPNLSNSIVVNPQ